MGKFLKIFIVFLLMLNTSICSIVPLDVYTANQITFFMIIFVAVGIFICSPNYIFKNRGAFNNIIISFCLLSLFEMIISKVNYNQDWKYIIIMTIPYFSTILYCLLSYYVNEDGLESIKKYFVLTSLIFSIILIIQSLLYKNNGITFLSLDLSIGQRFGEARIGTGSMIICIGVILSFGKIIYSLNNKKRISKLYIISLILGISDIIFVSKTRGIIYSIIAVILFMGILCIKGIRNKLKLIILIIFIFIIFINSPIFDKYKNLSKSEGASVSIRHEAIEYYIKKTNETPIFGMGIIHSINKYNDMYYITRGPKGIYFTDDVGIIGLYSIFGLSGLILYLYIIFRCIRIILQNKQLVFINPEKIGLLVFLIFTSVTIIITDYIRIFYLPIVLFMIEGNGNEIEVKNRK